jgi:hypothetical protein
MAMDPAVGSIAAGMDIMAESITAATAAGPDPAGAAIGVLATGAAIAYAGQPPAPGLCWYYTDPSYRSGFWDAC